MLALTAQQRRFVIGWVLNEGKDAAAVARAAGYSDTADAAKVRASQNLSNPKVQAALQEMAGQHLGVLPVLAVLRLKRLLKSKDAKTSMKAIDSVLDRTGFGRTSTQDIRVEHTDSRSTADLLEAVRKLLPAPAAPVIEGKFREVADGENA